MCIRDSAAPGTKVPTSRSGNVTRVKMTSCSSPAAIGVWGSSTGDRCAWPNVAGVCRTGSRTALMSGLPLTWVRPNTHNLEWTEDVNGAPDRQGGCGPVAVGGSFEVVAAHLAACDAGVGA